MHYTGPVYRPPFEANSLLLQATVGCSHNSCAFCTMYREMPFSVAPIEQIEADVREASRYAPSITRVFLENGDAFVLPTDRLLVIAELIHRYLPRVKTIAMYASISNIRPKTDAELKALHEAGIDELNIGVESGLDEALRYLNKRHTAAEAIRELLRLKEAGIKYGINIIFGAAGAEKSAENAAATAELLNRTQPYLIFTGTLHADEGCPLYDDLRSGRMRECTVGQYLDEEEAVLTRLEVEDCLYFGLHPSNIIPLSGNLPGDQNTLLTQLRNGRARISEELLSSIPVRGEEGAVLAPITSGI